MIFSKHKSGTLPIKKATKFRDAPKIFMSMLLSKFTEKKCTIRNYISDCIISKQTCIFSVLKALLVTGKNHRNQDSCELISKYGHH